MEKLIVWGHCWKCGHETPHQRLAIEHSSRVGEGFSKNADGTVRDRIYFVLLDVYQFVRCNKCESPALFLDDYWPNADAEQYLTLRAEVIKTGKFDGCESQRHLYPAFNKAPAPKWTHDLDEPLMVLLWEVYTAIASGLKVLAMMGIRSIVDNYANRVVGDIGGFEQKLKALLSGNFISKIQFDHLSIIVDAGNAASHRGFRPKNRSLNSLLRNC